MELASGTITSWLKKLPNFKELSFSAHAMKSEC